MCSSCDEKDEMAKLIREVAAKTPEYKDRLEAVAKRIEDWRDDDMDAMVEASMRD